MSRWKSRFIDLYRLATVPIRRWSLYQRRKNGQIPVYVLFYHRVADTIANPWSMTCAEFERQIDWLEDNFQIVDLEECQRRIASGYNAQPTVAITFDDGYAENCDFALPMLIERHIPVTYFVTLHHTLNQQSFQHDIDRGQELPVNTIESIRALSLAGVEIGAHTRNHPNIGKITDPKVLFDEVITSTREMEKLIEQKIRYFAFPFGQPENLSSMVFQMLKREGFLGACTTINRWNEIGGDPFQLSRVHGDPDFARFRNWLSHDMRLDANEVFDYQSEKIDWSVLDANETPTPLPPSPIVSGLPTIETNQPVN